jgi:hypothetical protein
MGSRWASCTAVRLPLHERSVSCAAGRLTLHAWSVHGLALGELHRARLPPRARPVPGLALGKLRSGSADPWRSVPVQRSVIGKPRSGSAVRPDRSVQGSAVSKLGCGSASGLRSARSEWRRPLHKPARLSRIDRQNRA